MEIKNLKEAAERISKAIKNREKIILYGDGDLDGVTSLIILKETIENLGGKVDVVYFPDREKEGYGISLKALNLLKKMSPALFISLDCGISNFKEIEVAKGFGFEVVVIDHHQILDELPKAEIIVNPNQPGDQYPFKELATVGIVFKLAQVLLGEKMTPHLRKSFLELVALGTIADMMPREADNKIFINEGLFSFENSWRPGIQVFFENGFLCGYNFPQKISKIISLLNVRDIENNLPSHFRLLTSPSLNESKKILSRIIEKSKLRKKKIEEILGKVKKRISEKKEPIVFEGDPSFDLTLISSVASQLVQALKKPVFLFKKLSQESHGTVRAPAGINSVELMKKCREYLISFGGHPQASGFRLKNENLEKFKECLLKNFLKISSAQNHEKNNHLY